MPTACPSPACPPPLDLAAVQRGEAAAWQELLARHGPAVYALCCRLDPDPDDAYQAIWEKVHGHLSSFDPEGPASLGTWLGTLARRSLVDRHRRRRVRGEVLDRVPGPEPSFRPPIEDSLDAHQQSLRLEAALRRLPPGQREVVVLHHIEGLPLSEIADLAGVAEGTLKSRLHRARARLVRLLGGSP